jgi:DNA polymerase
VASAGVPRASAYLTNAVKHFKWTPAPRGKRRIHSKPTLGQLHACRGWLDVEIDSIRPAVIVLLGASAVRSILGSKIQLSEIRGKPLAHSATMATVLATVHPAAILRMSSEAERREGFDALVRDLRTAARLSSHAAPSGV